MPRDSTPERTDRRTTQVTAFEEIAICKQGSLLQFTRPSVNPVGLSIGIDASSSGIDARLSCNSLAIPGIPQACPAEASVFSYPDDPPTNLAE